MASTSIPNSRKRGAFLVALASLLVLVAFLGLATWLQGGVQGEEFAPSHFVIRTFSFHEIPLVRLQVTPIRRTDKVNPLTNLLRSRSLVQVPAGPPDPWHLAKLHRGIASPVLADAEILTSILSLGHDGATLYWQRWSDQHGEAAARFWPIIQKLAERELYVILPELFEIAESETDPDALQEAIERRLRAAYVELAHDLQDAGYSDMAAGVLEDGLRDYPDDQALLAARAQLASKP
jgi:hypothetical protein